MNIVQNKFTKNIFVSAIALSFLSPTSMAFAQINSANIPTNSANPTNPPQAQGGNQAIMNFVGADIESVIKAVGQYTNTTFIIDPRVKGTINLVSEKSLSKSQAFDMLAATLRLQGFSVVRGDGFVKVVPEADAKLQVSPSQAKSVKGDQIATRVYNLNYESAINLVPVLRPLISPNNTINANPGNNTLVVTDYADNLNRISKMIASLDTPGSADVDVIPVKYAVASDLATMVSKLLDTSPAGQAGGVGGESGRVSLLADPRTNSVILRAPTVARVNLAKSLIAKLDQPTKQAGNVHVVYLKNADATKLAQTLRSMVSFDTSAPAPTTGSDSGSSGGSLLQSASSGGGSGSGGSGGGTFGSGTGTGAAKPPITNMGGGGGSGNSKAGFIQADASTNTLIITASEPIYRDLRVVIDQLDMRRQQVYIESLIVEVSDGASTKLGVQWLGLSGNSDSKYRFGGGTAFGSNGDNIFNQAIGLNTPGAPITPPSNGLTLGLFRQVAGKLGLGVLAQAFQNNNLGNVLSVPNLITLDNEEAKMIVGQNIPLPTGSFLPNTSGGPQSQPFQTYERKDVGVALRVKPQISGDGTVKMSITQEVSTVDPATVTNVSGATINKRIVDTNVVIKNGEILVLGGLMQETTSNSEDAVPGLSKIPIIGNLFKSKNNNKTKNNLLIFLRPTIIRDDDDNNNVVVDRYDYIQAAQEANRRPQSGLLLDTRPSALPALKSNENVRNVLDGAFDGALMNLNPDRKKTMDAGAPTTAPVQPPIAPESVNTTP
ncbi:MAG: type II secretion system secretin GspD [Glaciimonas sp.]|nr:type II secretion system secretin GspD [Glaciimonas sp.]